MNPQRIARAYKTISQGHEILSEGYAELARAYADEQPVAASAPPAPAPTIPEIERAAGAPLEPVTPLERANDRAQSLKTWESCPAHSKPFKSGRFGPYCPSTSDEAGWSNEKGYCTVTPSNAAAYARKHGMAA